MSQRLSLSSYYGLSAKPINAVRLPFFEIGARAFRIANRDVGDPFHLPFDPGFFKKSFPFLGFEKYGLKSDEDRYQKLRGNMGIYPSDCFCAFNLDDWHPQPTKRTYVIHYMASSWQPKKQMIKFYIMKAAQRLLGVQNYKKLKAFVKKPRQS